MFFDKFRDKYSFNFLSVCGWITFILFCFYTLPEIYITYIIGNSEHSFGVVVTLILISAMAFICSFVALITFILEQIFYWKIKNKKLLSNKLIFILQLTGIIFAILPTLLFLYISFFICFNI